MGHRTTHRPAPAPRLPEAPPGIDETVTEYTGYRSAK